MTGGSGFIGQHLMVALDAAYDVVDAIDLRPPAVPPSGVAHLGDVRDALPGFDRYDTVFHLAANVGGRAAIENGPLTVAGNLSIDVAFFDYVARTRPERAVYLSSSAIYPADDGVAHPLEECTVPTGSTMFGRPDGVYGWVKLTGEQLAAVVTERFGVPVVCYRPFSLFGPGQPPEYPVPAIIGRALARHDPITVWGSGRQVRDFVHVGDAVQAIVASHACVPPHQALNICRGVGTSFAEVARLAADRVGYHPGIAGDTTKPGGVDHRVGSPSRLDEWFTATVGVADGIAELVELAPPALRR